MDCQSTPTPSTGHICANTWRRVRHIVCAGGAAVAGLVNRHARMWRSSSCVALAIAVMLWLGVPLLGARAAPLGMPANASCATLAAADRTATNSGQWGVTLLRGYGAPGGWFGVDVCGNGINEMSPGGANLSCDRIPANLAKTGCAPGYATYDGFGLSFQCVELITRFSAWAFGDAPWTWHGNAPDLWTAGNHPLDFTAVSNGSSQKPVPGDVLVWGAVDASGHPWPAGPADAHDGHVAVIASVHGNQITTAEENVLWGQDNHPSDTLSLNQSSGHWYVDANAATSLPAYRWPATMSSTRALYGWLHSSKNTGVFNGHGAVRGTVVPSPAPQPTASATPGDDTSGGMPSLAAGVVVTDGGTLADLVWTPDTQTAAIGPYAAARGLGVPPGVRLTAGQTPSVIVTPTGERDVFVVGTNGQMYEARTITQQVGVDWRGLGSPDGARLSGSAVASIIPGGILLGALGSDGQLWWRAGPVGNLGQWSTAGRPSGTPLQGTPVLAGTPGSGAPMALALGADGKLYAAGWSNDPGGGWTAWQQVSLPESAGTLIAPLVPLFELPAQHATVGGWQDVAVDVVVRDGGSQLWWLHRAAGRPVWTGQVLSQRQGSTAPITRLLGGVVVPLTSAGGSSMTAHLYAESAQGDEMTRVAFDGRGHPGVANWAAIQPGATTPSAATSPSALAGAAAVMALGPDLSGMVVASGQTVLLASDQSGYHLLAPGTMKNVAGIAAAYAAQLWPVGVASTADAFGDTFSGPALDPRWIQGTTTSAATSATLSVANGTLTLPPALAPARKEITQLALAQETVTVRITLPVTAASSVQAGLAYILDERDQLDLAVARSGTVSFCAIVWGQSAPCTTQMLTGQTVMAGVLLRIVNDGTRFTGQVSSDGFSWQTVGSWSGAGAATSASATTTATGSAATGTATAIAMNTATPTPTTNWTHVTFTSVALYATDTAPATGAAQPSPTPSALSWPTFAQFTVTA